MATILRRTFFTIILLNLVFILYSQPDLKVFGNSSNQGFVDIEVLEDGTYLTLAKSRADKTSSDDILLCKFSSEDVLICCISLGDKLSDVPEDMSLATNGDILITGRASRVNPSRRVTSAFRVSNDCELIWQIDLKGKTGYVIKELDSKEIAVAGYINSSNGIDFFLQVLDESGSVKFIKTYGSPYKDYVFGLTQNNNGDIYMGGIISGFHSLEGHDYSISDSDILLIKTDVSGNEIWRREYCSIGHDFLNGLEIAKDDFVYLVGSSQGDDNKSFDAVLMKLNEDGDVIWNRKIGGSDFEYGKDISFDKEGNIYLCGVSNSYSNNENPDLFMAKFNKHGDLFWNKNFGNVGSEYAEGIAWDDFSQSAIVVGSSKTDMDSDYLLGKINASGEIMDIELISSTHDTKQPYLFPNPCQGILHINRALEEGKRINLLGSNGRLLRKNIDLKNRTSIDISSLPTGVYFLEFISVDGNKTLHKIIKV